MNKQILFTILTVFAILISCTDDNNDSKECGTPVIGDVKYTVLDSVATESATLGEWVVIYGSNFCDVSEIYFNDISASLRNAYIKSDYISINVPRALPVEETNTITLITSKGIKVTKSFQIIVPELKIFGLLNEYVKPGQVAYIEGENFDVHFVDSTTGAWLTFGDKEVSVRRVSSKRLSFKVPSDAQPNSLVHMYREDSLGRMWIDQKVPGRYKDTRNLLYTANPTRDKTDSNVEMTDGLGLAGYPDSIAGKYYVFKGDYAAWTWGGKWNLYANVPMGQVMPQYELLADKSSEDLEVVFEANVLRDWVGAAMKMNLWDGYEYHWAPYGSMSYRTNGWETVRVPLSEFKKDSQSFPTLSGGNIFWDWKNRSVYFHGPAHSDVFICWDNLRIIPKD